MDFNRSVRYPMEHDDWVKTLLVGGLMLFFSFLLVPLFVAYGYIVRAIRRSLSGDAEPPVFEAWGDLLVEGLQAWVIGLIYLLIPLIVAGFTIGGSMLAIASGSESAAIIGAGGLWAGFVVSGLLALVFGYLAVVALVNFADQERFGAAFDVETIRTVALHREYALAWLVSVGLFFVVSLVGAIPFIGWVIAPFATFYAAVVAADLWADGFSQALETTTEPSRPRDETPAA